MVFTYVGKELVSHVYFVLDRHVTDGLCIQVDIR
jgi:hypothetical protein